MTNFISGFMAEEQVYYVFTSSRRRLFVNTKTQNLNCFYLTEWSCNNEDENYAAELRAIGYWLLVFNSQPSRLLFP